jgi:dolichol-phosphate mannosyltransferase
MKKVAIIIPCFNEEDAIPQLSVKLLDLQEKLSGKYSPQFIFVDDGSKDKTFEYLNSMMGRLYNYKVIRHEKNKNLGAALKTGLSHLPVCEYVAFLDSDCTYEPAILTNLFQELELGADLTTVSPYHPDGGVEGVPVWRLFLSKGLSIVYRILLFSNLYTFTAMVRAFRYSIRNDLVSERNDFSYVAETFINGVRKGYRVTEVPCTLRVRMFGVSKMNLMRTIRSHIEIIQTLIEGRAG